jgi:hypothetical protein
VAYVGNTPSRGQWRKLTDISGSFNGVTTTFTTSVPPGTSDYYVTAGSASQLIISVGGVIQEPDVDYTVSTYSITFTTAPAAGLSFFGVLCGDALNVGTPGDGSVTTAKLGSNLTVDLASGTAASPSLTFDSNTGLYSPGEDQVGITTGGTGRMFIDSSGRLLVGTSTARSNIFSSGGAVTPTLQLENNTNTWSNGLSILNYSGSQFGSSLALGMSASNTPGTNALVTTGQLCGRFHFLANDGTNFYPIAEIGGWTDGTTGTGDVPGRLTFSTTADGASSPTERMRIANDGKIGFGTTTLTGNFNFDGSVFLFSQPSGAGNSTLKFNTSTGAVTYDTSSRLVKQNIEDCPYGLAELAQLKPRKYFRTDDQKVEIGFVADEVADVLPEFVPIGPKYIITKNEADTEEIPLGVNYEKLTAVLTKALQETAGEIELLKARIAALESA